VSPRGRLRLVRSCLVVVIVGLALSGVTAFPLEAELRLGASVLHGLPDVVPALQDPLLLWVERIRDALVATGAHAPFLAYGTDWLAFAHLVIAVAFLGALRDPVRNSWIVVWGMIAAVGVIPLAVIAGPIRGLPWGWTVIDCSFGVLAMVPLVIAFRGIRVLARDDPRFGRMTP
jgi:hypothetical protein